MTPMRRSGAAPRTGSGVGRLVPADRVATVTADDAYAADLPRLLHRNLGSTLAEVRSEKRRRITEAVISAGVRTYVECNRGANAITAAAHQQRAHLSEEHPEILLGSNTSPPLDLYLSGGCRPLAMESELGGPKDVVADLAKLIARPASEDLVLVTEAKSLKGLGRFASTAMAASADRVGTVVHVEIYRRRRGRGCDAGVRTIGYADGAVTFDSGRDAPD